MKKLLLLVFLMAMGAAFLFYKANQIMLTPLPLTQPVSFVIHKGDTLDKIARTLKENGLVAEAWQFVWYSKISKLYPQFKAGEYLIENPKNMREIAEVLVSGKVMRRKITFAEGLTTAEIRQILDANEFLTGEYEEFAEGEFLPETYTFSRGDSRQKIVSQAKKAMQSALQQAWNERDVSVPLASVQELLILASIIEKETGIISERTQVASVFVNRLNIGMPLQTDPTVIYAVTLGQKELGRPLYRKDLEIDSPYNTYRNIGLPPTPICNPGKEAIWAAAHPDKTKFLYFVASGNGGHNFAKNLSEHNDNVRKWRRLNK